MNPPLLQFVIGGVQKAGTSALARYMGAHPDISLPAGKEAHVFDQPDFDDAWDNAAIDRLYREKFTPGASGRCHGDATPIYLFVPRIVQRIARYNPRMRWIVLLRDPITRALSHYHMEHARGTETWPLWPAMALERWRTRGGGGELAPRSQLRLHSYRARSDYAAQLDHLYALFPREQVLLLGNRQLALDPADCLRRVYAFLGVETSVALPAREQVFKGDYRRIDRSSPSWWLLRLLMHEQLSRQRKRYPALPL